MRRKWKSHNASLRITAYSVTIAFVILILFPLFYLFSNSTKDSLQIYEVPPSFLPQSPTSISVKVDYTELAKSSDRDALLDALLRDSTMTLYAIPYELNEETIGEIKFYGVADGKTIFYTRAHRMELQLNLEYGLYKGANVRPAVLLRGDKYKQSAESIGYRFNPEGLDATFEPVPDAGRDALIGGFLKDDYEVQGAVAGFASTHKAMLVLENYKYYFELPKVLYGTDPAVAHFSFLVFLKNTGVIIVFSIVAQVLLCSLTAYPISRLFRKRTADLLILFFLGTLMVPFVVTLIPTMIMFRQMGMYDNYWGLLVPSLYPFGFYVFLFKGFFDRLPGELFEAAKMDGASTWRLYWQICMPLSVPIISLVALSTFLGSNTDFFWAFLITEKPSLYTMNAAIFRMSQINTMKTNYLMGMSLLIMIPPILLSILFSSQIKRSVATSGLKG